MIAGQTLYASELIMKTRGSIGNGAGASVLQIADAAKQSYTAVRNEKIEEQLVIPHLGPDYLRFRERGVSLPQYLQAQPNLYQNLVVQMVQFNLSVEILIAGIHDSGSHLYYLGNPGTLLGFDKLGYNSIGSGSTHAAVSFHLGNQNRRSSLPETLFSVFEAKRSAEVAPGVGVETEMAIISRQGVWTIPAELMEAIGQAREAAIQEAKPELKPIEDLYERLQPNA